MLFPPSCLPYTFSSDHSHTAKQVQPECQCESAEKCRQHHNTRRQYPLMSHISCHDIRTYRCGRTKHHKNGDQFLLPESKHHSNRQKYRTPDHQFQYRSSNRRFDLSECFFASNAAPIAINPSGVASFPRLSTVLIRIGGQGSLHLTGHPARIPRITDGCNPFKVFFISVPFSLSLSGFRKASTTTAITLLNRHRSNDHQWRHA